MSDPLLLVPKHFTRVKIFQQTEIFQLQGEDWVVVEKTEPLEDQIDRWLTLTANLVQSVSSPLVNSTKPSPDSECYVTTCSVVYVPAAEGVDAHARKENELGSKIAQARAAAGGGRPNGTEASGGATQKVEQAAPVRPVRGLPRRPSPQMGKRTG